MNECKTLHETAFGDVLKRLLRAATDTALDKFGFDDINGIKNTFSKSDNKKNTFSSTSLARMTSNLVLVFPVMISRNISYDTAMLVTKAIERKGVQMVQMVFAANQITNSDISDVASYLRRFHSNIKTGDPLKWNVDNFMSVVNRFAESQGLGLISPDDARCLQTIREDMKNIEFYIEEDINSNDLNNISIANYADGTFKIKEGYGGVMGQPSYTYAKNRREQEEHDLKMDYHNRGMDPTQVGYNKYRNQVTQNRFDRKMKEKEFKYNKYKDKRNFEYGKEKDEKDFTQREKEFEHKQNMDFLKYGKDQTEMFGKQLLDNDIKKANEMMATTLAVNFIVNNDSGRPVKVEGAVIGVKARLIPVESNDIITHLLIKAKDSRWLLNFFRATTRETSFVKDFLFGIDNAKMEALSRSKRGSSNPMWKVLERRSIKSAARRLNSKNNDAMAITSLIVSQDEIDYIRKENNLNFEDFSLTSKILENYNLLCFGIMDENLEIAKFLFDTGEAMWENYTFRSLDKENKNDDYKKIINLMSKM